MGVQLPLVVSGSYDSHQVTMTPLVVGQSSRLVTSMTLVSPLSSSDLLSVTLVSPGALLSVS